MRKTPILAVASAAAAICSPAHAAFVVDLVESGTSVLATGSGTLDLTDLHFLAGHVGSTALLWPQGGAATFGASPAADLYGSLSGPIEFGPGDGVLPSATSGDVVGESFDGTRLLSVPAGYVSGDHLANAATYDNTSFASLGASPGVYVWSWGQGAHADTFTLNVGPTSGAVPEPAAWALLLTGFAAAGALLRRRGLMAAELSLAPPGQPLARQSHSLPPPPLGAMRRP